MDQTKKEEVIVDADANELEDSPQDDTADNDSEEVITEDEPQKEEVKDEKQEDIQQPKPVPGETEKEKALRLEIERLRGLTGEKRSKELFNEQEPVKQPVISNSKKDELLKKYNPEDLSKFKEVLEAYAEDFGFVKKDDFIKTTYNQSANTVLKQFLTEHPQYSEENDKDNLLWNRFKKGVDEYKTPTDPYDYQKIFTKVHKEIFNVQSSQTPLKEVKAQQQKIKSASHAGQTPGKATTSRPKTINESDLGEYKGFLKGFTDEEKDEILGGI